MKTLLRVLIIAAIWLLPFCLIAQDTWTQKADFGGIGRTEAVSFAIGSKGYIVTGEKYDNGFYICNRDLWEYDPATNIWSQKADFGGVGRYSATGFSIGTKGYVGWGLTRPFNYLSDFWEYDAISNTWSKKADLGSAGIREAAAGFSIGSKGYVGTGTNHTAVNGIRLKDFWEYDPASDVWTRKADFAGVARCAAARFSINSKGYIGTGISETTSLSDFWEYNPVDDTWRQKAAFGGGPRMSAVGFSIGLNGYIGTGIDEGSNLKSDFWEYSVENDNWTKKADFGGIARGSATGFSIGTKGYIGTGWTAGDIHFKDFWEYDNCVTGAAGLISGALSVCPGQEDVVYTVSPVTNAADYIWTYSGTGATISGSGNSISISFGEMATSGILSVYGTGSCGHGLPSPDFAIAIGQSTWIRKADFPGIERWGGVGFSIGSKGYLVTGAKYNNGAYVCHKDLWEYDPSTGIWSQKADFGGAGRFGAVGFSTSSKGYVGWGLISPFNYIDDFWEYDPVANGWTKKADLGSTGSREGGIGFSVGNKGYMGTGCNHKISYGYRLKDFWEYDPAGDTWTRKADAGGDARVAATGFSIGSKGYIGTGESSSILLKDFWEYTPANNTWSQKADFGGIARHSATGFSIGNYGYIGTGVFGGVDYDKCKDFWEYSVETDSWTQKSDFGGAAKSEATGFSIGTKGYIGCGNLSGQQQSSDFWEFDPGCRKEPSNIDEHTIDAGWMQYSIYPNPNSGKFIIKVKTSTLEVFTIEIYNIPGSRMGYLENLTVDGSLSISEDMQSPAAGVYTIVFRNRDKSVKEVVSKFIVTK
ncbi:MAG: T9SS type A sorting domain-containing protein [Bacteroidetes bacterium]|nr:T9SS type A sorting domain-containing protein [Bacteroidota bacterium]